MARQTVGSNHAIWVFAGLYFACYVPFTGLTKAVSSGTLPGLDEGVPGAVLLPISTAVSLIVTLLFITGVKWWKYATHKQIFGLNLPVPTRWTALSGICTSVILTTTTLAYTFEGVSIVFVMLLMRGGVLIIAPIVDAMTGRKTRWFSWVGLGLSMSALVVTFADRSGYEMNLVAGVDVLAYVTAYFIRLRFMSRLAKSDDPDATRRYFVEEQLMTAPFTMLVLTLLALIGQGAFMEQLRAGFTDLWAEGLAGQTALIGLLSQGVGIFGTLVFLDKRENTFSVPVNRASSILAGVVASVILALWLGHDMPTAAQFVGAGLVICAILVLSFGPQLVRRKPAAG